MANTKVSDIIDADSDADSSKSKSLAGFPIVPVGTLEKTLNILIYGEPGVGKTMLAGSSSAVKGMSPVLLLDIEGGTMSLNNDYPNVDVIRVTKFVELHKVLIELRKGSHEYKTVIVDSLSEAQKLSMNDIMEKAVREDPELDRDVPTMRAWGQNLNQMRRYTRGLRDLPVNVIFTALVDSDKNNRGKTTYRPMFQGKTKGEVPGFMDIVAHYYIIQKGDNDLRMLLTQQTDTVIAKDRSNKLPKLIENPTMTVLYDYITGNANKDEENK